MTFKVLQVNLHHSKAASASFCRTFTRGSYDVALIQEPWVNRGRIAGLADTKGKLIHCDSIKNMRTCVLVKHGTQCLPVSELCSRDITTIEINWSRGSMRTLFLSSVYLPYDSRDPPPSQELRLLVDRAQRGRHHLVVGCDANAHSQLGWGSTNTNPRGEALLEYLISNNLEIANIGNQPTFENKNRREVIDITFCSFDFINNIKDWNVKSEASLSDHKYIQFQMDAINHIAPFRDPKRTNWVQYSEQLDAMTRSLAGRIASWADMDQRASSLKES